MLAVITLYEDEDEALRHAEANAERVVGIYKVPTLFCEGLHPNAKKTQVGYTQGQRWGWWVCAFCMKPKRQAYDHMWKYMAQLGWDITDRLVQEGKLVAFTKSSKV